MTYDEAKILMITHFEGGLSNEDIARLDAFINANPAFKQEYYSMKNLWGNLEQIETPEPSIQSKERFHAMLKGYQEGVDAQPLNWLETLYNRFLSLWQDSYVPQAVLGIALLLLGIQIGYNLQKGKSEGEINGLAKEVQDMKEMMMLTLLEKQSAHQRLKAVSIAYELENQDDRVSDVLFKTLQNDENINVRLAAIEAIFQIADRAIVREKLVDSLLEQESPIVQSAIIDVIAALQEKQANTTIQNFLKKENINPAIREKAQNTLKQL